MDKSKILTIVTAVLGLIGVILLVRVFMAGDESIQTNPEAQGVVDPLITYTKFLLIIAAVIAIVFSIINLVKNPADLKMTLLGIVVLGVLLAIAYFTASGDAVTDAAGKILKDGEAGSVSKWVSALINFTGILGVVGILMILFGVVKSSLNS